MTKTSTQTVTTTAVDEDPQMASQIAAVRTMLRKALAYHRNCKSTSNSSGAGLDAARWSDVTDSFLAPFVRFLRAARHGLDDDGELATEEDPEAFAPEAVKMILNFAGYVEAAERRGALPAALDRARVQPIFETDFLHMLPPSTRDRDGRRVLLSTPRHLASVPEADLDKLCCWFFLHASTDPSCSSPGLCVVHDLKGLSMSEVYRLLRFDGDRIAPSGCFPIRVRRVIVLHPPWWIKMVWSLASRLEPKLGGAEFVSGDLKKLHEVVDPQGLPPSLGGSLKDSSQDAWLEDYDEQGTLLARLTPYAPKCFVCAI